MTCISREKIPMTCISREKFPVEVVLEHFEMSRFSITRNANIRSQKAQILLKYTFFN